MNDEIKRRAFLAVVLGGLFGAPIATRLLLGKPRGKEIPHHFSETLEKYQRLLDIPVHEFQSDTPVTVGVRTPVGAEMKYVIFSSSHLPANLSQAIGGEPDLFLLREGKLFCDKTDSGQEVITGGDSVFEVCSPTGTDQREAKAVTILVRDGRLRPARIKGGESPEHVDTQFLHLLSVQGTSENEITPGTQWSSEEGRVRPFGGYTTEYKLVGLAEIGGRKTFEVAFAGEVPNMVGMTGTEAEGFGNDDVFTNKHSGRSWFDLETGLLVREETDMETFIGKGKESPQGMTVKAKYVIQLFLA